MTAPQLPKTLDKKSQEYFEQLLVKIITTELFAAVPSTFRFTTKKQVVKGMINALFSKELSVETENILDHYWSGFIIQSGFGDSVIKLASCEEEITKFKTLAELDALLEASKK